MKIRVADYIANRLQEAGAKHVFLLNGGMMMHLVDTLGRPNGLEYVCNHHEQASAIAADGYARLAGRLGVCYATSGPGATNTLTGIAGAWQESTPVLFLTGQVKSNQTIHGSGIPNLRQFGTFEVDIVPIVKSVTKYAHTVMDPKTIRYHFEKAMHLALTGRTGPVLLDLPLDVQGAQIDPDELEGFSPGFESFEPKPEDVDLVMGLLKNAQRPLFLAGYGIRCAQAVESFRMLAEKLGIPVATSQLGKDVLYYDHPLFVGHPGPKGERPGNFAVQTADLILSVGCSLHSQTTGWESELFAPSAVKVQVELDDAVLARENVGVTHKVKAGCAEFVQALMGRPAPTVDWSDWRSRCHSWKTRYPVYLEPHERSEDGANFYHFVEALSKALPARSCAVADAGSAFYVMGQGFRLKDGQRFISSGSLGAMGFALPAANGASVADPAVLVACVTGDGSLLTNLHDLATMRQYNLNVKLFVVNNDGYVSMRNTQREFFGGHYVGADHNSGVFIPTMESLAKSFGLPFVRCAPNDVMDEVVAKVAAMQGPVFCEVVAMRDQKIIPAVTSVRLADGRMQSSEIQNMSPLLPPEVLAAEMANPGKVTP